MISDQYTYGVHFNGLVAMVKIGRFSWKRNADLVNNNFEVIDADTYQPVPDAEAVVFAWIEDVVKESGLRVLNNSQGKVSAQLAGDPADTVLNIWYHLTDATAGVSLSVYQAPWDDVNDRIDTAVGVLIAADPDTVMKKAEQADAALLPHLEALLKVRKNRAEQPVLWS